MKQLLVSFCLLLVLGTAHLWLLEQLGAAHAVIKSEEISGVVVPSELLRVTALEHAGVVADYLFLETLAFFGQTFERTERPRIKDWEWPWLHAMFERTTDLDPYFVDPYVLASSNLTWEGGMYQEVNALLDKGIRHRYWDPALPFMAGFNAFYFIGDNGQAAQYMMESFQRPGSQPLAGTLAVRLAANANKHELALLYLEETMRSDVDSHTIIELERRREVISTLLAIERAAEEFFQLKGEKPVSIEDLVHNGLLPQAPPRDPYGGTYILDDKGEARTTSNMFSVRDSH